MKGQPLHKYQNYYFEVSFIQRSLLSIVIDLRCVGVFVVAPVIK